MEIPYNLRQVSEFSGPIVKSVYPGIENISYLGPKNGILPEKKNLVDFKEATNWKPDTYPCRLCKAYIEGVGFP